MSLYAWSWTAIFIAAGVVIGVGIVTAVGVLVLEAQRRRDDLASAFQNRLAEPIARELGQAGVSVLPTVRIPLWTSATRPAVIRLTGRVPSRDIRDRVPAPCVTPRCKVAASGLPGQSRAMTAAPSSGSAA